MLITSIKYIIFYNNFNFDEKKSFIRYNKFNENKQIVSIF